jgi:hypothetical protein
MSMQHAEFRIGETFRCGGHRWRCTDIGTRVIAAIKLDHDDDLSWYNGPPYAVAEMVFDEDDMEDCTCSADPADADAPKDLPSPACTTHAGLDDNLVERIRQRFVPLGGADDLELPPRELGRDPAWISLDLTLAEVRSKFSDLPPEELEAIIAEAVAAARNGKGRAVVVIDESEAQETFDSLLDRVECGTECVITRKGNAVARMISTADS